MIRVRAGSRKSEAGQTATEPILRYAARMSEELAPEADEGHAQSEDGTRIYWSAIGEGAPALVCCDGIGCDGFAWKYLARDFAPRHRVIRWHYRGHGRSGLPADRTRVKFDDLCDDLSAVLEATRTPEAVLLGHSMGVQVALEYHRRHPARVLVLGLICGSHGLPLDTFHDSRMLKNVFPSLISAAGNWPDATGFLWRLVVGGEWAYQLATHLEVNGKVVRRRTSPPISPTSPAWIRGCSSGCSSTPASTARSTIWRRSTSRR